MDWISCNKCGSATNRKKLLITTCSHIFCECCLNGDACVICKVPTKSLEIGPQLPKHVLNMFRDSKEIAGGVNTRMLKTLSFQKFHRQHMDSLEKKKLAHKKGQLAQNSEKIKEAFSKTSKFMKMKESTQKKLSEKELEIQKLEKMIDKENQKIRELQSTGMEELLNTQTVSLSTCPSVSSSCSSRNDHDVMIDFDLLAFDNASRTTSASSTSSVSSVSSFRTDPLF